MIDKLQLRAAILARLAVDLDLQTRAAHLAREEATSEESKAEGKYDTRAQEAAYLAEGQARQAAELLETIALFQALPVGPAAGRIAVGSMIRLTGGREPILYLLGPRAGGLEVDVDGTVVTVVTPVSPLGRQLLGRQIGETVIMPGRGQPVLFRISEHA
jgi:transcription elongation GreA/GreB family factor